jgi:hypothetical protein
MSRAMAMSASEVGGPRSTHTYVPGSARKAGSRSKGTSITASSDARAARIRNMRLKVTALQDFQQQRVVRFHGIAGGLLG